MSTVLVANSDQLRGSCLGEAIDRFTNVVRFNDYTTDPVIDWGERTTHHVVNDLQAGHVRRGDNAPRVVWYDPFQRGVPIRRDDLIIWHQIGAILRLAGGNTKAPSSGLAAVLFFILHFGPVTLAGFNSFRTGRSHNHNAHGATYHDWDKEAALLAHWKAAGLVKDLN